MGERVPYFKPVSPQQLTKLAGWAGIGVVVVVLLATSFYMVDTDEIGVVQRFGKYVRETPPGLHAKLPFRIEVVTTPKVKRVFKEEFGFRTIRPGIESAYTLGTVLKESLMLCGDLNVAEVEWAVHFKISEPRKFLFKVRNPRKTIRDVSEAVMRAVVGDSSVDEVLTIRRTEINMEAQKRMQEILDAYESGIKIDEIKLQDVNPPEKVKPAFDEVNSALQDKEKYVNKALEEYNKVIPRARGEAKQVVKQAEAYAINRTNVAKGDARRFEDVWKEYKEAKDVTRRRLYLETLAKILPDIEKKYIVDSEVKGLLPLLKLGGEK